MILPIILVEILLVMAQVCLVISLVLKALRELHTMSHDLQQIKTRLTWARKARNKK